MIWRIAWLLSLTVLIGCQTKRASPAPVDAIGVDLESDSESEPIDVTDAYVKPSQPDVGQDVDGVLDLNSADSGETEPASCQACDDSESCTIDDCVNGVCIHTPEIDGLACNVKSCPGPPGTCHAAKCIPVFYGLSEAATGTVLGMVRDADEGIFLSVMTLDDKVQPPGWDSFIPRLMRLSSDGNQLSNIELPKNVGIGDLAIAGSRVFIASTGSYPPITITVSAVDLSGVVSWTTALQSSGNPEKLDVDAFQFQPFPGTDKVAVVALKNEAPGKYFPRVLWLNAATGAKAADVVVPWASAPTVTAVDLAGKIWVFARSWASNSWFRAVVDEQSTESVAVIPGVADEAPFVSVLTRARAARAGDTVFLLVYVTLPGPDIWHDQRTAKLYGLDLSGNIKWSKDFSGFGWWNSVDLVSRGNDVALITQMQNGWPDCNCDGDQNCILKCPPPGPLSFDVHVSAISPCGEVKWQDPGGSLNQPGTTGASKNHSCVARKDGSLLTVMDAGAGAGDDGHFRFGTFNAFGFQNCSSAGKCAASGIADCGAALTCTALQGCVTETSVCP